MPTRSKSKPSQPALPLDMSELRPGMRIAVAVSGGADSVALLVALAARRDELGLVLSAAHVHHGLRGAEADEDRAFAAQQAQRLGLEFFETRIDTRREAEQNGEGIEEAARRLRYAWFRALMAEHAFHAVATAHTRDDQAETVLAKFLRGAWTEGLSGIHPVLEFPEGRILRPLLPATRGDVEGFLRSASQGWRDDSSNADLGFTRNRIRHELLPQLDAWNPRLREHLAHMAELARDEQTAWDERVAEAAAAVLMSGTPVRGGGRAGSGGLSVEIAGLRAQPVALQRRMLRLAAEKLDARLDFAGTESLRNLALSGRSGQRCELANGLRAERTHRELRMLVQPAGTDVAEAGSARAPVSVPVPGTVEAPDFGIRIEIQVAGAAGSPAPRAAVLRLWKAGDRVRLRHSSGERKVKEVLERMNVSGSDRAQWPVIVMEGKILWMQGVMVEPVEGIEVRVTSAGTERGGNNTAV